MTSESSNSRQCGDVLRVCLDASSLTFPPSGIRTYVDALVTEFRGMPGDIDLLLAEPASSAALQRLSRFWWDAWGVGRAAGRAGADVLHVPQFAAPVRPSQPLVVTIHDLIPLRMAAYRRGKAMRLYLEVMQRTVRKAAVIIVPSAYVAATVSEMLGIEKSRIRVIPMAASARLVPAPDRGAVPGVVRCLGVDSPYVFNIAGFDARKNVPCLLEAFALFHKRAGTPYKLVIAGAPHTGNKVVFPPIDSNIERLGLSDHVVLPGLVPEATKIALYQHASMYVTPSLEEGFGLTCLEAMACGIPTIAANRASLPEVLGEGGLLVEPDPQAVSAAMLRVAESVEIAGQLRIRGLARAAKFSWAETAKLTVKAYRASLNT